jgi:hypothetical protein
VHAGLSEGMPVPDENTSLLLHAIALHSNGVCEGAECGMLLPKVIRGRPVQRTMTTLHASATRRVVMDVYAVSMPTRPGYHVMAIMYVHFSDAGNAYGSERFCRKCMEVLHPEILEALTGSQTNWV